MTQIRYAVRRVVREPWSAAVAVATVAIAIGACTAMFSIVQAVLLRPMGIESPARVVVMWPTDQAIAAEFPYAAARTLSAMSSAMSAQGVCQGRRTRGRRARRDRHHVFQAF